MAKKRRFAPGCSTSHAPHDASEGSNDSGHADSRELSPALKRKWIDVNSSSRNGLAVPMQIILVSKLSTSDRKKLLHRLKFELKKIQLLQSKIVSGKKTNVNGAAESSRLGTEKEEVQKGQQISRMKKSSGFVSKEKGQSLKRSLSGKFESINQKMSVTPDAGLMRQCEILLKKLMSHKYSWVFNAPVDVARLNIPDYFDIIKNPMDLGTVMEKLTSGKYSSPLDFVEDVRLTFINAKTYNAPGTEVHFMAETLSQFFEIRWKAIEKKLTKTTSKAPSKKLGVIEEVAVKPKKRKLSPVRQVPGNRKMTNEEKLRMGTELEKYVGDLPESILEFLKSQSSNSVADDELEIDIDSLSDETLFTLRALLDDHLFEKQKNLVKSEACEIELPNVSGFSNSSAHAEKGSDPVDQNVDIGENNVDRVENGIAEEGERVQLETQVSPDKLYRAALLKNRFADTILKAREKTLVQDDKSDPDKLRRKREELEMLKAKEKARLQEEARAAENAQRRLEAETAAKERKKRELEREAAREALLKMEKSVEMNENSGFLEDLEMLRVGPCEQAPSCVDEISPEKLSLDAFGSFKFLGNSNPLEQLGLYMKVDDEYEDVERPVFDHTNVEDDVEEGEID